LSGTGIGHKTGIAILSAATMRNLPLGNVYQKLEPGPVVLLTTEVGGRKNVMAMSWHMMVEFEPPLIACIVSSVNYSHAALKKTRECVIAIPAAGLADKVVRIGNCSGRDVDKFAKVGLTPKRAKLVCAPLVGECAVNIECRVADTRMVGKYNLFILEAMKAWVDPKQALAKMLHHQGYGAFVGDGETIRLKSKKAVSAQVSPPAPFPARSRE
jgi:flavin reductase (DIM6/NTAB) family NADH-FMN oxidoreductase RutF